MFRLLFERSADAILLFEPSRELFVDCNDAALALLGAQTKDQLLMTHPTDLSPEYQPDGKSSRTKTTEMIQAVLRQGCLRFEWLARRLDGTLVPVEVLLTVIEHGDNPPLEQLNVRHEVSTKVGTRVPKTVELKGLAYR